MQYSKVKKLKQNNCYVLFTKLNSFLFLRVTTTNFVVKKVKLNILRTFDTSIKNDLL